MADSESKRDILIEKDNSEFAVSGKRQIQFCKPCSRKDKESEAKHFCIDCVEYQCSDCSVVHKVFSFAINHNIVSEREAEKYTVPFDMKGLDQCKLHKKLFEFICEDHDHLCCSTCAIIGHRKCHSVVEIEQRASSGVQEITTLRQDLLTTTEKANAFCQNVSIKRSKFVTDADNVTSQIKNMKENVEKMFERWVNLIEKNTAVFQQQLFDDYNKNECSINQCIEAMSQTLSDIERVAEDGTMSQQLILSYQIRDHVTKMKTNIDIEIEAVRDVVVSVEFHDFLKLPPTEDTEPGIMALKYINLVQNSQTTEHSKEPKLLISTDLEKGKKSTSPVVGMDFLPDGRLITVEYIDDKCVILDQQLKKLGSTTLEFAPCGVVSVSDDEIAITCRNNKVLYIAVVNKSNIVTVTRSFDVTKRYQSICLINQDEFLVGTEENIQPVSIISKMGSEKELGLKIPARKYPMDQSACSYISYSNKVVFTDKNADTVYICDVANNTSLEVKNETIEEPRGVAVGLRDNIFVCSEKTNSIVHLSCSGKIIGSYRLNISVPSVVCISKDYSKLAVTNIWKNLQLYDISHLYKNSLKQTCLQDDY